MFKKIVSFLVDSYKETKNNVSWPSIDNDKDVTFIVIFFLLIICCISFIFDLCSRNIVEYFYIYL